MSKKFLVLGILILSAPLYGFCSAYQNSDNALMRNPENVIVERDSERRITVSVEAGERFRDPQTAIWIEKDGRYIETLFVTEMSGQSTWLGGPSVRRPEALPVWAHARGVKYSDGLYMPDSKNPLPDAIASATPRASYSKTWQVPTSYADGEYVIKLEVNNTWDYNQTYRSKSEMKQTDQFYNGESGQPSIVYEGKIKIAKNTMATVELKPAGHGHPAGLNGKITPAFDHITTALEQIKSIKVEYMDSSASTSLIK